MLMPKTSEITVVTFATFGRKRNQRDYTFYVERIRDSCLKLGLDFLVFSFRDGAEVADYFEIERPLPMRKGAGYWSWKPNVVSQAAGMAKSRYVLYIDADVILQGLPKVSEIPGFSENGIAVFSTSEQLVDWTSKKCLKAFGIDEDNKSKIVGATIILIDKENMNYHKFLFEWGNAMRDITKLLDPFWSWKMIHRHDQSILSCLIAISAIRVSFFRPGFYGGGIDNGDLLPEEAWVVHGESESHPPIRFRSAIDIKSKIFHKIELASFLLTRKFCKSQNTLAMGSGKAIETHL